MTALNVNATLDALRERLEHQDEHCPTDGGLCPDCAAMVAAIITIEHLQSRCWQLERTERLSLVPWTKS